MKGKTHLHEYFKKKNHTDLNQKKKLKGKNSYYEELRCIQTYKSSEKGWNANKKADTTCQKSMCVHTGYGLEWLHVLQVGSCWIIA